MGITERPQPGPRRDIVVVGASAGGVEALTSLTSGLPEDFTASVFVVLHVSSTGTSVLPAILGRAAKLPVMVPTDGQSFAPGTIYVAQPNCHMVLERDAIRMTRGPKQNGFRPAIDPLFTSAAESLGARVAGVILSGTRDDGVAGLGLIKQHGGLAIVQDPDEAPFRGMPDAAIDAVSIDEILPVAEIAPRLAELARGPRDPGGEDGPEEELVRVPPDDLQMPDPTSPHGPSDELTRFTCPECGGVLGHATEGGVDRYVCSVGHIYSTQSLLDEQGEALEAAMWIAVRSIDDRVAMLRRLAERVQERGGEFSARGFARQAGQLEQQAATLRQAIESLGELPRAAGREGAR
jgi:two-component system chemotaxis response regulator CheB